jgi:hypothetical protein
MKRWRLSIAVVVGVSVLSRLVGWERVLMSLVIALASLYYVAPVALQLIAAAGGLFRSSLTGWFAALADSRFGREGASTWGSRGDAERISNSNRRGGIPCSTQPAVPVLQPLTRAPGSYANERKGSFDWTGVELMAHRQCPPQSVRIAVAAVRSPHAPSGQRIRAENVTPRLPHRATAVGRPAPEAAVPACVWPARHPWGLTSSRV